MITNSSCLSDPDWYLKKYFDEVFRPDPERVLYAHLDAGYKLVENPTGFIDGGGRRRDIPHVCHCITYCPKTLQMVVGK